MSEFMGLISIVLAFVFFSAGAAAIVGGTRATIFSIIVRELVLSGASSGVDLSATVSKFRASSPLDFKFHLMIVRYK
jgi:hypothetical protein